MNTIIALIPYAVPSALIVIAYYWHRIVAYIPAQQRQYILQFAHTAVMMVEQQFAGKTNEEKKQIAMDAVKGFFVAFNLPVPPDAILSAFIEAAVKALNASNIPPVTVTPTPTGIIIGGGPSNIAPAINPTLQGGSIDPHFLIDPKGQSK
jgi:LL-H family phage holin